MSEENEKEEESKSESEEASPPPTPENRAVTMGRGPEPPEKPDTDYETRGD